MLEIACQRNKGSLKFNVVILSYLRIFFPRAFTRAPRASARTSDKAAKEVTKRLKWPHLRLLHPLHMHIHAHQYDDFSPIRRKTSFRGPSNHHTAYSTVLSFLCFFFHVIWMPLLLICRTHFIWVKNEYRFRLFFYENVTFLTEIPIF